MSIASTMPPASGADKKCLVQSGSQPPKVLPYNTKTEKAALPLGLKILRVKQLHAAVTIHVHDIREKALRIGELLVGIKDSLGHGKWLPWLAANLPEITPRTAQNYMRVWTHRVLIKNESNSYLVETLTEALASIAKQQDTVPEAVDSETHENAVDGVSERSRKRELLRDLGRDFIKGLEIEDVAVLELVASRLPDWRLGLLTAARRKVEAVSTGECDVEDNQMAA